MSSHNYCIFSAPNISFRLIPRLCRVPDITLHDDIAFLDSSSLFPSAFNKLDFPQKRKQSQLSDDLFIMPSVPESTDEHVRHRKAPTSGDPATSSLFTSNNNTIHNSLQENACMNHQGYLMDGIMDVPDLPPDAFDMFHLPMDDAYMNMDHQYQDYDQQHAPFDDHRHETDGGNIAAGKMAPFTPTHQKAKRGKRSKRVVIDALENISLSSNEQFMPCSQPAFTFTASQKAAGPSHRGAAQDRANEDDKYEHRRRGWMFHQTTTKTGSSSAKTAMHGSIRCDPATGPWSKELMEVWQHSIDAALSSIQSKEEACHRSEQDGENGHGPFDQHKKARNFLYDDTYQEYNNAAYHADGEYAYDLAGNYQLDGAPYDLHQIHDVPHQSSFYDNPFAEIEAQRAGKRFSTGTATSDGMAEAERLRAALHSTPGNDYRSAMFQLGLTPASEEGDHASGQHRFSNKYRRDSTRSGKLSERFV